MLIVAHLFVFMVYLQEWRVGRLFAICIILPLSHTCRNCLKRMKIALDSLQILRAFNFSFQNQSKTITLFIIFMLGIFWLRTSYFKRHKQFWMWKQWKNNKTTSVFLLVYLLRWVYFKVFVTKCFWEFFCMFFLHLTYKCFVLRWKKDYLISLHLRQQMCANLLF